MENKKLDIEILMKKAKKEVDETIEFPSYIHAKVMDILQKEPPRISIFNFKIVVPAACLILLIGVLIFYPQFIKVNWKVPDGALLALEGQTYILNSEKNSAIEESLKGIMINLEKKKGKTWNLVVKHTPAI